MEENSKSINLIACAVLGIVWIYQGIVPKILFPDTGEMEMLMGLGIFKGSETKVLIFIGLAEVAFGLIIFFVRKRIVHIVNIIALIGLGSGALLSRPEVYTFPFNPFTLSISMMALSVICLIRPQNVK